MPSVKAIHHNPAGTFGKTRCGRKLFTVAWRADIRDVTCNLCIKLTKGELAFNRA